MYKIYINQKPVFLMTTEAAEGREQTKSQLIVRYMGVRQYLFSYIDKLEKGASDIERVIIHSTDVETLKKDFFSIFSPIEAAGGVVYNDNGETLMIFRMNHWDLPKGKIDDGETPEEAAVREVQEETGIQNIELGDLILETYHSYRNRKNKRKLKRTYWYLMHTTDTELTPQAEEDIEKAVWMRQADFLAKERVVYGSILDVLEECNI